MLLNVFRWPGTVVSVADMINALAALVRKPEDSSPVSDPGVDERIILNAAQGSEA
jgi:hypothetical protein